jgi:hypothetical protein
MCSSLCLTPLGPPQMELFSGRPDLKVIYYKSQK